MSEPGAAPPAGSAAASVVPAAAGTAPPSTAAELRARLMAADAWLAGPRGLACLVAAFALVALGAWIADDAYISLRVVDNFVHGHGLRWNVVDRVQVFTHPLWLFVQIPLYAVTRSAGASVVLSSLACLAAVAAAARRMGWTGLPFAVAVWLPWLLSASIGDYVACGLETPLHLALLAWFIAEITQPGTRWGRVSLLAALLMVNRLDAALLVGPACVVLGLRHARGMDWARIVAGATPLPGWLAFSTLYFGTPFPNTKYAKLNAGIPPDELAQQGLWYLTDFALRDAGLLLVVLGALALALRHRNAGARWLLVGAVLHMAYVVRVGGDFMSGRFFAAPAFVALWCGLVLAPAAARLRHAGLVAAALLFGFVFRGAVGEPVRGSQIWQGIADERGVWAPYTSVLHPWHRLVAGRTPHETIVGQVAAQGRSQLGGPEMPVVRNDSVGILGFFSGPDVLVLDPMGLGDPLLARLPADPDDWRIGHFGREIPDGYAAYLRHGELDALPEAWRPLAADILLVTRAPLSAEGRAEAIERTWR